MPDSIFQKDIEWNVSRRSWETDKKINYVKFLVGGTASSEEVFDLPNQMSRVWVLWLLVKKNRTPKQFCSEKWSFLAIKLFLVVLLLFKNLECKCWLAKKLTKARSTVSSHFTPLASRIYYFGCSASWFDCWEFAICWCHHSSDQLTSEWMKWMHF